MTYDPDAYLTREHTTPNPRKVNLALAERALRDGLLRSHVVRTYGIDADDVAQIKARIAAEEKATLAAGRCVQTEDLFK